MHAEEMAHPPRRVAICPNKQPFEALKERQLSRAAQMALDMGPQSPKLKGSIGEGSNHSNFSHQSSVKIALSKRRGKKKSVKIQCILLE